jgi:hypothetical protein
MRRYLFVALSLILIGARPEPVNKTDSAVKAAAESQLGVFLSPLQPGDEAKYGFVAGDDLDRCTIGKPYRSIAFSTDLYDKPLADNIDYITIHNEWRVPVQIKGENRCLLTLTGAPTNLKITSMGDPELAQDLQLKSKGYDESDNFFILRIAALPADFFVITNENSFVEAKFIPLHTAYTSISALGKATKTTYTLSETQEMVKDAVAKKQKEDAAKTKAQQKKKAGKKKASKQ